MNNDSIRTTVDYLFRKFDSDKNSKISFNEYLDYLRQTGSTVSGASTSQYLFNLVDVNRDGALDKNEWIEYLRKTFNVKPDTPPPTIPAAIAQIRLSNLYISEQELGRVKAIVDKVFSNLDQNGDRQLGMNELGQYFATSNLKLDAIKVFRDLDKSGDGKISWEEFAGFVIVNKLY